MDKIAKHFIVLAEWDALYYLGEDGRRPMPVEDGVITRENYNTLVCFVRERLG